jgi:hypothetical protein
VASQLSTVEGLRRLLAAGCAHFITADGNITNETETIVMFMDFVERSIIQV